MTEKEIGYEVGRSFRLFQFGQRVKEGVWAILQRAKVCFDILNKIRKIAFMKGAKRVGDVDT